MEQEREPIPERLLPVLRELKLGRHNLAIAEALNLEPHTVESYVSQLLSITGSNGRGELIARLNQGEFDDLI